MNLSNLRRLALLGSLAIGLAACAGDYGPRYGGGYNASYDRYYGDAGGYSSVPYGYAGANFGWSGTYYYPGTGTYVFDRAGRQRQWNRREQRYWERRARQHQNNDGRRGRPR
jgi:hypothetical protein